MQDTLETIRTLATKIAVVTEQTEPDVDYIIFLAEKVLFLCEGDGAVGEDDESDAA